MSLDAIDPFPWFLSKPLKLEVNDQEIITRITASQWADHWRPFLARLRQLWLDARPRRFLVAIAGPPGAGKSVLAEELQWIISRGILHREAHCVALPMDGFHYPQAYLETHTRKLPDGTEIPLAWVKGQLETLDIPALRQRIKMLTARTDELSWPGYSRRTHDIVPSRYSITSGINLVFIEGNYLLLDKGPFAGIPPLFDLRIYLDIPPVRIMGNLMSRHIAGGKDFDVAKDWVKRIDLPNARIVESTRHNADVIIHRDLDAEDLSSVRWRSDRHRHAPQPAAPAGVPAEAPAASSGDTPASPAANTSPS